jgi:hypothetical protein
MYRFADGHDKLLVFLGALLAMLAGVAFPLFMYYWGK